MYQWLRNEAIPTHQLNTHPKGNKRTTIGYTSAERACLFFPGGTALKNTTITVLDARELSYAALLEGAGLSRSVARVIVCLMVRQDLLVREIARATEMSPALAAVALRKLREYRMVLTGVSVSGKKSDRRYRLVGDWECILALVEQREEEQFSSYLKKAGKVRKDFREKYEQAGPFI
jgi:predicted transcriptional regulator